MVSTTQAYKCHVRFLGLCVCGNFNYNRFLVKVIAVYRLSCLWYGLNSLLKFSIDLQNIFLYERYKNLHMSYPHGRRHSLSKYTLVSLLCNWFFTFILPRKILIHFILYRIVFILVIVNRAPWRTIRPSQRYFHLKYRLNRISDIFHFVVPRFYKKKKKMKYASWDMCLWSVICLPS